MLQVDAGYHTMCVTEDVSVLAFGNNELGGLGMGDTENKLVPIATMLRGELANKSVLQIAAGDLHTLGVTADGLVFAWGYNSSGQLGAGDTEDRLVPGARLQCTVSLTVSCTCWYDEIKGTQDLKIYSHADSLILSNWLTYWPTHWLVRWLTHCLSDWLVHHCLTH